MCFSVMLTSPEMYKDLGNLTPIHSGKLADLTLIGTLVYGAVVTFVNFKILQDANSFTIPFVSATMFSWMSFFIVFFYLSQQSWNSLYHQFDCIWRYPQYALCLIFFAMTMWPVNSFLHVISHRTLKE